MKLEVILSIVFSIALALSARHSHSLRFDLSDLENNGMDASQGSLPLDNSAMLSTSSTAGSPVSRSMVKGMTSSMMKSLQMKQLLRAQMQQQELMQMQTLRMRMAGIMASNRDMKGEIFQMRRHMPGGCNCCQSCPAAPAFGAASNMLAPQPYAPSQPASAFGGF